MKRGTSILALTVLLAAAATGLIYLYLKGAGDVTDPNATTVSIIVSKSDIPANTDLNSLVESGTFTTTTIARNDLLQGAITDVAQLRGQTAAYPILAGEQIVAARLKGELQASGGALGITPGHIAVTVQVSSQQGIAGMLTTGDEITVYATFQDAQVLKGTVGQLLSPTAPSVDQQAIGSFTVTLVPTVRVLATQSQTTVTGDSAGGDVLLTLDLTKPDAQDLVFAQENGHLWFGLLPPGDNGRPLTASTIPFELLLGKKV
jgi:Flp pilus assembly protein CpaB